MSSNTSWIKLAGNIDAKISAGEEKSRLAKTAYLPGDVVSITYFNCSVLVSINLHPSSLILACIKRAPLLSCWIVDTLLVTGESIAKRAATNFMGRTGATPLLLWYVNMVCRGTDWGDNSIFRWNHGICWRVESWDFFHGHARFSTLLSFSFKISDCWSRNTTAPLTLPPDRQTDT